MPFAPFPTPDDVLTAGRLSHIPLPLSGATLSNTKIDDNKIIHYSTSIPGVDDAYTKLLMHMDGTNGGTIFTEESGKAVTVGGNVKTSTTQIKFGTASAYFDGDGDYLKLADSADWQMGTGDFTIDFWFRTDDVSAKRSFLFYGNDGNNNAGFWLYHDTDGKVGVSLGLSSPGNIISASAVSVGVWHHFALVRYGSNFTLYIDGTSTGSLTDSSGVTVPTTNPCFSIGREYGDVYPNTYSYKGYIDELRISKGIARWISNFTPNQMPYNALLTGAATFRITPAQLAQWKQLITYVKLNTNNSATYTIKDTGGSTITGPTALANGLNVIDISSLISAELYKAVDVIITLDRSATTDASPELHYATVLVEGQDELAWRKKHILTTAPTVTHYANTITNTTGAGYLTTIINGYTAAVNVSVQIDSGTIYKYTIPTGGYVVFGGYGRRFNSSLIVKADQTAVYVEGVLD
ncbi:MAG: LamG domain-containing protein [Eubacteriales bacterium]|jgi:hypothetical protein|nr:LamG domain-containing protein [Eubacteriales bacterium]